MASQRFPCLHTHETRRRVPTVHSHSLAPKQSDSFEGENPSGQSAKRLPKHTTTNTVCRRCFSEQENRPVRVNLERAGEKRSGAVRDAPVMGGRREWEAVRVRADLRRCWVQTAPVGMEAGKDESPGIHFGLAAQQFTDIFQIIYCPSRGE